MTETTATADRLSAWLALNRARHLGPVSIQRLLEYYPSAVDIFAASASGLAACGLNSRQVESLLAPDWAAVEIDLRWQEQDRAHICVLDDAAYPVLLRQIPDPPPVLYLFGHPEVVNNQQIAVVGSRTPTPMGKETAHEFATQLAALGWVVTSGLAHGIDAAAHRGAVSVGGRSIAVVGTGLDRVYPARHRKLAHEIAENGLLISEFPLGSPPRPGHFPRRNRIISGLSQGVLVVEAALRSGSLITARLALEQGREVFAVPGSIRNSQARGCNTLIREGAKLVQTVKDIVEEFADFVAPASADAIKEPQEPIEDNLVTRFELDGDYCKVLENVGYEPTSVDKVVERSGLTVDAVCSMLLVLELQGYVATMSGGRYCLIR
ncbi:Rossmann fold nucleotide-binding protein Smf possibly involved in DNA uptake [hydrothermal vent metagenome]|uniref:Rossmann fold nucleotide-binding protein Smf possibly involved in DNA uptake n=1 Tax=hydrothermal vent metagenome TaxID=652676 RepID=A0A3B1B7U5_9ZZZZ